MLLRWILSTGGWGPNILASATTARTNRGLVESQNTFLHCAFQMLFSTVCFQMTNSRSTLLLYEIYQIWPFEVGISFFTKFYIVRFRFCSSALYLCWYSRGFTAEVLWWFQTLKTSLSLLCTIESKQLELTGLVSGNTSLRVQILISTCIFQTYKHLISTCIFQEAGEQISQLFFFRQWTTF